MTKTSSITLFLVYCNMVVFKKQDTSIYWWYSGQWHIAELLLKHPDFDTKEVRKTNCKYRKNNLFVRSWNHVCPQAMQTNTRKLLSLRWIFEDLIFVSEMNIHCWCTVEDWIFQQWNSWWDTFTDYTYMSYLKYIRRPQIRGGHIPNVVNLEGRGALWYATLPNRRGLGRNLGFNVLVSFFYWQNGPFIFCRNTWQFHPR